MNKQQKLDKLSTMANNIIEHSDHWIGNHPDHDNGGHYCRGCCEKHINSLINGFHIPEDKDSTPVPLSNDEKIEVLNDKPFIDGGWSSEYDCVPTCNTCHTPLTGSLTETAITEEISHFLEIAGNRILVDTNLTAWNLDKVISSASNSQSDDINKIINKISF
jgi:hypothetical protein